MNIQELKEKSSEQLIKEAENLGIENASTLRRQEIYFAILKKIAPPISRNILCVANHTKMKEKMIITRSILTLIELLVVIVIISILATLLFPSI